MSTRAVKAIHSAARRYCHEILRDRFRIANELGRAVERARFEEARGRPAKGWRALAPPRERQTELEIEMGRLQVAHPSITLVAEVLARIEASLPGDFSSVDELLQFLGSAAETPMFEPGIIRKRDGAVSATPASAREDTPGDSYERELFRGFLAELTVQSALALPEFPFRHSMSQHRRRKAGKLLRQRWGVDPLNHYWYPLEVPPGLRDEAEVLALQSQYFWAEIGLPRLRLMLLEHGITRLWELNEFRLEPEYEMHPDLWDPYRFEIYASSKELDWIVYVSHEGSITFGGSWLIERIKQIWPNWEERIYSTHDYE